MPVLYKQIPISVTGMVSAQRFDLPGDGRKVFFDIYPGGTFRKDIYIVMDGKLRKEAFENGTRMETPVYGMERVLSNPHEAFAIVVDRTEQLLQDIYIPITPIPVTFCDGRNSVIELSCSLRALVFPQDSAQLAQDFAEGIVSDPVQTAAGILKGVLLEAAAKLIPAALKQEKAINAVGRVDEMSLELARFAAKQTERLLPWCRVTACEVELTVDNMKELVDDSNFLNNLQVETQRKLLDAILSTFGSSPLPAEVSQVLLAFVQANPGLPSGEIKDFCQGIQALWSRTSPAALFAAANQVGLLPTPKGGN